MSIKITWGSKVAQLSSVGNTVYCCAMVELHQYAYTIQMTYNLPQSRNYQGIPLSNASLSLLKGDTYLYLLPPTYIHDELHAVLPTPRPNCEIGILLTLF